MSADGLHDIRTHGLYGKYEGVVTRCDDPLKLGRIKARVPSILGEQGETAWAWPCVPMAGAGRGALLLPERNDLVWIEFAGGDLTRPIWSGVFWKLPEGESAAGGSAQNTDLPEADGKTADEKHRIIRTQAGHTISFDDEAGVVIVAAAKDKAEIRLTKDGDIVITAGTIKLGGAGAAEKLVLGDAFMGLFNRHVHPTGMGPSGPPQELMAASSHLSQKSKTE